MDADAKALGYLYTDPSVLVPREQNGISNSMIAGQVNEIGHNERVNALLLAIRRDDAEAQLDVVRVRYTSVLSG